MPAINSNASVAGETTYAKLRRLYAKAQANGHPHVIDPSTGLPQLAAGTSVPVVTSPVYANAAAVIAAGYAQQIPFTPTDARFYPTGGSPETNAGRYFYASFTNVALPNLMYTGNTSHRGPNLQRLSFGVIASKVIVQVNTFTQYRILVNNRYLSLTVTTQPSTTGYVLLDFTSAGGRLKRNITIEIPYSFYTPPNIFLLPQDEILPAPISDRFRMIVLGDSTVGGSASPTSGDAWSQAMTDALGVPDGWQSTIGGTGYNSINPAGTGLNNLPTRIGDAINYAHDACMFAMNINDVNNAISGAANLAAIQPNFDLCYNAYRAAWSTTPLFILGVMGGTYGTVTANISAYEQLLAAYVAAKNDPNAFFIPVMSSQQPWVSGTGFVGNNTNDGNAQFYVAAATPTTAPAVASGGAGWAVNDQAVGAAVSPLDQPIQVKVTAVSGGVVTAVSLVTKGTYTQSQVANPVTVTAVSPSAGTGLTLTLGGYTTSEPHIGGYGYIMEGLRCANSIIDAIAKKA